tara:strand:+ start:104 stop:646 length:543 start_codon:yes stop_codon:yes gene_type:complete
MIKEVIVEDGWTDKSATIKHNLDTITYRFIKKIGAIIKKELKSEIRNGVFATLNPSIQANGLVNERDYLRSIDFATKKVGKGHSELSVGSTDEKALLLEYGGGPRMYTNLQDSTMIEWARSKGLPNPEIVGKRVAQKIRTMGTVPKPVFRRTIQKLKFEGIVEGIKEEEGRLARRPEGID